MSDPKPAQFGPNGEAIVPMRLQKFLARAGAASRRGSENLMTAGRVRVNGEVVTELGSKVDPLCDVVEVDGVVVRLFDSSVTIMLNKPAGYLTTMSDPHGRPCVASLVPTDRFPGLFPVGRLDMDTTGLLLFSTVANSATACCTRATMSIKRTMRVSRALCRKSRRRSSSAESSSTTIPRCLLRCASNA